MRTLGESYLMMGSQDNNEGNLVINHSLFCRRKLVYYTNAFHLIALSLTHCKVFLTNIFVLHQLLLGNNNNNSYCQAGFALYFFFFFYKIFVIELIIENITAVKMRYEKGFIYCKAFLGRQTESILINHIILMHFLIFCPR